MRTEESTILLEVFETIFEFSYDPLYVIDGKGRFLKVNEAFSRFYGYSQKELIGKYIDEFYDLKGFSTLTAKKALVNGKRVVDEEVTGSNRFIRVTAIPVFSEQYDVVQVVCNIKDITNMYEGKLPFNKPKQYKESTGATTENDSIISNSQKIKEAFNLGKRIANVNSTALILGESGVGKNVLARYIHQNGYRYNGPFIEINCGAISESLLESELFGYSSGAFTGAKKEGKKGHIEMANNGTLFLDEVGEMSLVSQVKLLHFLQNKKITKVGSSTPIHVDVRVITATNKNLEELVREGKFRQGLFYRLNVVPIQLPPLRERKEDILPLIQLFMKKYCELYGMKRELSQHAIEKLIEYQWPGNVRELQNVIERVVVTSVECRISVENLPKNIFVDSNPPLSANIEGQQNFIKKSIEIEAQEILSFYRKFGSTYKAAAALGMSQSTFFRKLRRYEKEFGDLYT